MIKQRRRVKHIATFEERLAQEALQFKEAAKKQPNGSQARELPLRRARRRDGIQHRQMRPLFTKPSSRHMSGGHLVVQCYPM
jgi:hypothetical protein